MIKRTIRWLKKHRWYIAAFFAVAVAFAVWSAALARSARLEVSFLNVGQGDAVFIEFPEGTQVLIDGGPNASVLAELSQVMPPWDSTIDVVIATHPDADHIGGLPHVFAHFTVAMIVDTGMWKDTEVFRSYEAAAAAEGAERLVIERPVRLRLGDMAVLDVLWPAESRKGVVEKNPNAYAVVTRLVYGTTSFLFTGDIERGAEYALAARGALAPVDVLKVPHHGSRTSTSLRLLAAVRPELAIISVGADNRYGHPVPEVLDRLEQSGAQVLRTDMHGRVTVVSNGAQTTVQTARSP